MQKGFKHSREAKEKMRKAALIRDNKRRIAALPRGEKHWNMRKDLTKNILEKLYLDEDLSQKAIAKKLNASNLTIFRKMKKFGIKSRDRKETVSGSNHWKYKEELEATCKECKKEYRKRSIIKGDFCSQDCYWQHMTLNLPAEHKRFLTSSKWKKLAKKIKDRDLYECQDCGMIEEEHKNRFNVGLHVHHIISRAKDATKAFVENNLITLCASCHLKTEKFTF